MKSSVKISIERPCAENWEQMLPAEQGRHCAACERLIIDFSVKTDQEILEYIKQTNGKLCGRFNNEQLERNLIQETKGRKIGLWEKVAASLLFFISVDKASASDFVVPERSLTYIESKTDTDKNIHRNKEIALTDSFELKGTIVDEKTKETIPFVFVFIEKYNLKTQTDFDGKFKIMVPKKTDINEFEIIISTVGYNKKIIKYKTKEISTRYINEQSYPTITLSDVGMSVHVMGIFEPEPLKWYQFWKK
jgi:CarboxypepD_reg-like domain